MNIGLVLAGGMAKGAYQIGALKAIEKYIKADMFSCISCSSVGALNGYSFAAGCLDMNEEMWYRICEHKNRVYIGGLLRSNFIHNCIEKACKKGNPLPIPVYTSLLNIQDWEVTYKDLSTVPKELLPTYLDASVAVPLYNSPIQIGKNKYYDGAWADNIPVYPIMKHPLDYIIAIYFDDFCYKFENSAFDEKIIKIIFPADTRLMDSFKFTDDIISEMITHGYEKTDFILRSVFANGIEDKEFIYKAIQVLNQDKKVVGKVRITGDVVVTNLNRIIQKFAKRKIKL